mgnify:CR=1 FL=1
MRLLFLLTLLLAACESSPLQNAAQTYVRPVSQEVPDALGQTVLDAVNQLRAKGCHCPDNKWYPPAPALRWNDLLAKSARRHALDMQKHNFFKHTGSDGSEFTDRIKSAGYHWQVAAENLAMGHNDALDVVKNWETSEGHCQNLMHPELHEMGLAKAGRFWVQDFGALRQK